MDMFERQFEEQKRREAPLVRLQLRLPTRQGGKYLN